MIYFAGRLVGAVGEPAGLHHYHQLPITVWHIWNPLCRMSLSWPQTHGIPLTWVSLDHCCGPPHLP